MKSILIAILLTTMSCCTLADRYYSTGTGKVPYVKSSNRAYEKSWNSYAKQRNISNNVMRGRAATNRFLNSGYSSGYSGGGYDDYVSPEDEKAIAMQNCINNIKPDPSKGDNTNVFKMRKQRLACTSSNHY